jgi:hypothetical protein
MLQLVEEIEANSFDREAVRLRRQQLADAAAAGVTPAPPKMKPFTVKFKSPDRVFSLSLSFRTETEPDRQQVIRALETILDDLRHHQD